MVNEMTKDYYDADAVITIKGREYALYRKGALKATPYMVDVSTGEIPEGEQRPLLAEYLIQNSVDIEPWETRTTHWCVRQAIKVARGTPSDLLDVHVSASVSAKPQKKTKKECLSITEENIVSVHKQVLASTSYGANFTMIHDVLNRFPQNDDRELVAMKVSLIDLTNSTNISKHIKKISLAEIAELIVRIQDFDERVSKGDPTLVSQLAKTNGSINLFSFASKYCTYHNVDAYGKDDYSIFDSVVQNALPLYVPNLKKSEISEWRETCNYAAFNNCIGQLLDRNDIHIPFRRRKFDHFLWYTNRK